MSTKWIPKFRVGEQVRILGERKGSINEFARVQAILEDRQSYWVTNLNMPYSGTISDILDESKISRY